MVMVAPTAVCRGDEGTPIHIGDYSNVQDGVVVHALETTINGTNIDGRRYSQEGQILSAKDNSTFSKGFAVWVGDRTSLAHGAMIHGPAWIGSDTFIGMESTIFNAKIGNNVAVGVSSTITGGVVIPDNKFVPPGSIITTQKQADSLPPRIGSPYESTNKAVIHVNEHLAEGYGNLGLEKAVHQREVQMEEGMMETGNSAKESNSPR
jgi:carbon dioxide concentrating mechanism protein CcmM